MTAYYNEIDKKACAALRQLMAEGTIAPGFVDERSIKEVQAHELRDYTQWHFFAGAGIWSVSARAAGWPDARPIGTASCPCQPYSGAGLQLGVDDPRHLWPDLYRIIRAARAGGFGPPVWMGEQVAKAAGYGWFDGVCADLARENIASRTVDIPACAIDAPHERNRLYWIAVANAYRCGRDGWSQDAQWGAEQRTAVERVDGSGNLVHSNESRKGRESGQLVSTSRSHEGTPRFESNGDAPVDPDADRALVDAPSVGWREGRPESSILGRWSTATGADVCQPDGLDHPIGTGWQGHAGHGDGAAGRRFEDRYATAPDDAPASRRNGSHFADWEWIACHDGKARRAKPGVPMLVDGMAGRSDLWSLAGNSISPILAAEVIAAFLESEAESATAAPLLNLPPLPY